MTLAYDIVAFDKDWLFKGHIDPSGRSESLLWIHFKSALAFIKANKPKDEHWLIEVIGEGEEENEAL